MQISALPKEQAACRLDEYHDKLPVQKHDTAYVLGRLGDHNVVLACLPSMGTNPAARCASNLQASFPNIRFILMVGIGGGVPIKHDIRLGDVIVSMPTKDYRGVCQYDFGTRNQDGPLKIRDNMLNRPPDVLITAVAALHTKYTHSNARNGLGQALSEYVDSLTSEYPEMQNSRRPALDELYKATYRHLDDRKACEDCNCDEMQLAERPARGRDVHPRVHQGLIASGNTVMKDAIERDRLAQSMDILCFEMEAGGLMADLGCLIIRGICDYCDSHKNKGWQDYAAAVAAGYARELLMTIAPLQIPVVAKQDDDASQKILDWLSEADYANQQTDLIRKREDGTGRWFLESSELKDWLNGSEQTLFCPGHPGAGKTFITCGVVQTLLSSNDPGVGVCYFYCNYGRQQEQKLEHFFASLLRQLVEALPQIPRSIIELYKTHSRRRTSPSANEYLKLLEAITKEFTQTLILIDALDELSADEGAQYKILKTMFGLQSATGAQLFATSRPIPELSDQFQDVKQLSISANEEDLQLYLQAQMGTLSACVRRSERLQQMILTSLMSTINGIFLFARLYIDSLRYALSPKDIKEALGRLPRGSTTETVLNQAYRDTIKRIQDQPPPFLDLARRVILWLTYSERQLSIGELQHALAVQSQVDFDDLDEDSIVDVQDLVSVCAGLVTVDDDTQVIRFVHYTTQEFFERTLDIRRFWFPNARAEISTACLLYLSFRPLAAGPCKSAEEFKARCRRYVFLDSASRFWGPQARQAESETWKMLALEFLSTPKRMSTTMQVLEFSEHKYLFYSQKSDRVVTGMHVVARFGLHSLVGDLLKRGIPPNTRDVRDRTPLWLAAREGHEAVVKLLLECDDVVADCKGVNGWTPLLWAAREGHEAVVKLLLECDDVVADYKDGYGQTPLWLAAREGHEAVVKLLLECDDVVADCKGVNGWTPLSWAAGEGHEAVVKLLVERDVDIDHKDNFGRTALHWAALYGNEAVVKLLLECDVEVDCKDDYDETPLACAEKYGYEAVVRLLAERNVTDRLRG
ncbi:MAG: hypothetical protein M1831_006984 [Alyxoria varia]|nr:MAG: hypothetical protein M1831_006984 [Alyxoria varia]